MQNERLLQEVGLNAYEAAAYLSLLKLGVSEASAIYRDSEVPMGKSTLSLSLWPEKALWKSRLQGQKSSEQSTPSFLWTLFLRGKKLKSKGRWRF
nr:helix-turn-helix domain-containing protein [Methanosarcina horonobensis]